MSRSREWEPVIGLEVHVQLKTESKLFSTAPIAFGQDPNRHANLIDVAMPGTLPVLNEAVLEMAIRFGLAIDGNISNTCRFDRKNYFYPDLPKGYQISQLYEPIIENGKLPVILDDGDVIDVAITRAHLEEDAGKSIHDRFGAETGIDLNRAGTPLLEVVTEPDLRSSADAAACFRQLHTLVTWLDICDGNLAEGSMRCDANVSVRPVGETQLGERTEIKNINSFRFVKQALDYEIDRQIELLSQGERVVRETRLFDPAKRETRSMRAKELSDDYRYFPDPDLLPVQISTELKRRIAEQLPQLPLSRFRHYVASLSLPKKTAARLCVDLGMADYFDGLIAHGARPNLAANWLHGEVAAALNRDGMENANIPIAVEKLARLIKRIDSGEISTAPAKEAFIEAWEQGSDLDRVIDKLVKEQVNDQDALHQVVTQIVAEHPDQVAQIKAGKTRVKAFLVGQVMKTARGRIDAKRVSQILDDQLADS